MTRIKSLPIVSRKALPDQLLLIVGSRGFRATVSDLLYPTNCRGHRFTHQIMRGQAAAASGYLIQITARSVNRSHHLPVTAMVVMPIVMPMIAVRVVAVVIIIRWDNVVGARDDRRRKRRNGRGFRCPANGNESTSPTTAIANIPFVSFLSSFEPPLMNDGSTSV